MKPCASSAQLVVSCWVIAGMVQGAHEGESRQQLTSSFSGQRRRLECSWSAWKHRMVCSAALHANNQQPAKPLHMQTTQKQSSATKFGAEPINTSISRIGPKATSGPDDPTRWPLAELNGSALLIPSDEWVIGPPPSKGLPPGKSAEWSAQAQAAAERAEARRAADTAAVATAAGIRALAMKDPAIARSSLWRYQTSKSTHSNNTSLQVASASTWTGGRARLGVAPRCLGSVALVLGGQMRTYRSVHANLAQNVLDPLGPDVFISTWSESGQTLKASLRAPASATVSARAVSEAVGLEELERLFEPCAAEVEEFPSDGSRTLKGVHMAGALTQVSQLYGPVGMSTSINQGPVRAFDSRKLLMILLHLFILFLREVSGRTPGARCRTFSSCTRRLP